MYSSVRMDNIESFNPYHFNYSYYITKYPDLQRLNINNEKKAIAHYITYGKNEFRIINEIQDKYFYVIPHFFIYPTFDSKFYCEYYKDLRKNGLTIDFQLYSHLIKYGIQEQRLINANEIKMLSTIKPENIYNELKKIRNVSVSDSYYKKPFILIISCKQNFKRIDIIKSVWLDFCKIPYKIVIGDNELDEDYIIKDDYLYIKVDDDYKSLPLKIKKTFNIISTIYDPDCIIKIDDDVIIKLKYLYNYISTKKSDYEGNISSLYIYNSIHRIYCGGPCYFISKQAIKLLVNMDIIHRAEDVCVGNTLFSHNIQPKIMNMYIDMYDTNLNIINKNSYIAEHYNDEIYKYKRRVYVELHGGIGNILFQIAFLYYLKQKTWIECFFFKKNSINNTSTPIHGKWDTNKSLCFDLLNTIEICEKDPNNNIFYIDEPHANIYNSNIIGDIVMTYQTNNTILRGYFQSEKYFSKFKNEIINIFKKKIKPEIYNFDNDCAFIHIRGGDFLIKRGIKHLLDLTNYYKKCILKLGINVKYIIYTNDIEYSKHVLNKLLSEPELDGFNYIISNTINPLETLYQMSQCKKGCITANSSFSWWGSYLNESAPVYMPNYWYSDSVYYPDIYYDNVNIIDIN